MTRFRKLSTTLLFLSATALAGAAVHSTPALAAKGGIPGPNPDAPGQIKKANGPTINTLFPGYHGGNLGVNLDQASGQPRELNASEINLSDQLVAAWTNFASTGNPNAPGDLVWPVFTTGSPVFLSQNIPSSSPYTAAQFYIDHKCDFWYPILGYPTS